MQLRLQFQRNPVADEVAAVTAIVRPILEVTLYALKADIVAQAGGYERVTLGMLARLYRPGDGDCGVCFEYAVHDALNRQEPVVMERVDHATKLCKVRNNELSSILFGLEKSGALNLIDTVKERLTAESRILTGERAQPPLLKRHIDSVASAFRRREDRENLPWSISGLWKADLFVGCTDVDRWVAATVKINRDHLEGARGLRIAIIPTRAGATDAIEKDEQRNLVVCPIPHDGSFMEVFYQGWGVVRQFIAADAQVPREVSLPRQTDRVVARYLAERRNFPVLEVIEALAPLAQPELIETIEQDASLVSRRQTEHEIETRTVVAPVPAAAR